MFRVNSRKFNGGAETLIAQPQNRLLQLCSDGGCISLLYEA